MTISKKKKIKQKIMDALKDKAEPSTDRGGYDRTKYKKPNKKVRRHSGRYTPRIITKTKFSEMIANAEEPTDEYDEWITPRDGFRDITRSDDPNLFRDEEDKEIAMERNKKIKKQLARRKAKENKFKIR